MVPSWVWQQGIPLAVTLIYYVVMYRNHQGNQALMDRQRVTEYSDSDSEKPQPALRAPSPRQEPNINETCSICIERIGRELHSSLECSHIFHKKCIDNWSKHDNTSDKCPNCRSQELYYVYY